MSDIKRYLVEEVVVDHGDGHISRREALHRLSLLGLGAATAGTMLAGCAGDKPGAVTPDATPSAAPSALSSAAPSATSSAAPASTAPPGAATALATEARCRSGWAATSDSGSIDHHISPIEAESSSQAAEIGP